MHRKDIDTFFTKLAERLERPCRIILTGGAASLLLGGSRPTHDIDFCLRSKEGDNLENAISVAKSETDIGVQYSDDIDRWSSIAFLDYDRHTIPYKTYGKIKVEILEPEYWSIGKMARFYDSDVSDMVAVFKSQKTKIEDLISLWKKALKASPRSNVQVQFKRQAYFFIKNYGSKIWGKRFENEKWLKRWEN